MKDRTPEEIEAMRRTWGMGQSAESGQRRALGVSERAGTPRRQTPTSERREAMNNGNGTDDGRKPRKYATPAARTEPVTFQLNDQEFKCHPAMPSALITDIWEIITGDTEGKVLAAHMLDGVFWQVMDDDEFGRFDEYVQDPDHLVHSELLLQIALDLVTEYTGRPFGLPSPSPAGPQRTRATSTAASPSSDST